jgi:CheY-like chemotaxis protein
VQRIRTTGLLSPAMGARAHRLRMDEVILVIDDNPLLLATLGEALATESTTLVLATGADALQKMQSGMTPDVIVIDLDMRNGYALLVELEAAIGDPIPVVALSSQPRRLLEAGVADAVVVKPFEVGQLRRCVQHACEQPRGAI